MSTFSQAPKFNPNRVKNQYDNKVSEHVCNDGRPIPPHNINSNELESLADELFGIKYDDLPNTLCWDGNCSRKT